MADRPLTKAAAAQDGAKDARPGWWDRVIGGVTEWQALRAARVIRDNARLRANAKISDDQ